MKVVSVLAVLSVPALVLAGFSIFLQLQPQNEPAEMTYLVKVYGDVHYRVYVLVNSITVIADEFEGYKLYPVFVVEGDKIEVRGYCDQAFTVTLEDSYQPVKTETGVAVSLSYTVPAS